MTRSKINLLALVGDKCGTAHLFGQIGKKFFRIIHEIFKIGIGPVKFTHGELWIVSGIYAFISEIAIKLEYFFKSAHEKAL